MLKKREIDGQECLILYELMTHPDVFPFVRQKAYSYEEFLFLTKQTIEAEEQGKLISRVIIDEWENPIGTINLFDIDNKSGFIGTWIGKSYHGRGYNSLAKEAFFKELFFEKDIDSVFMKIRQENIRSKKAAEKLPYVVHANLNRPYLYNQLNPNGHIYDIYEIPKDLFTMDYMRKTDTLETLEKLKA